MSKRVLVTGGGGFLGSHLALTLARRGDAVTSFSRGAYPELAKAGIRHVAGDIRDATSIRQACERQDVVFHVAALAGYWGRRRDYYEINVGGTEHVIDACRAAGVPKLVFTSSPSVVSGAEPLVNVDETRPYPPRYLAHYPQTKAMSEARVLAEHGKGGLLTIALRPHLIWGPGDNHLVPRVICRARAGQLRRVGDGENLTDHTFIDNAVTAHLLAEETLSPASPAGGQAFFITNGEPVKLWTWIGDLLAGAGVPPLTRSISAGMAWRAGAALEAVHACLPWLGEPRMTRFLAHQLSTTHTFSVEKARRLLGYEPVVRYPEALALTLAALRDDKGA